MPGRTEGVSHYEILKLIEKSVIFINEDKKALCNELVSKFNLTTTPEKIVDFFNIDSDEIVQAVIDKKIIGFFKYWGKHNLYIITGSVVDFMFKKRCLA